jgi:hypothetical protein
MLLTFHATYAKIHFMNENLSLHPEIEKTLEISGENIGRVKNIELAQDQGNAENAARDMSIRVSGKVDNELYREQTSQNLRHAITRRVVVKAAGNQLLQNITTVATGTEPRLWKSPEQYTQELLDEAKTVADDYNKVERMAEDVRRNREK